MDPEQLKKLQAQFQEISNGLASNKPDEVKSAQTKLQALGYDVGTPDGVLGGKTSAAIGQLRKTISDAQSNIATTSDAEARKAESDPVNQVTKFATNVGPYAAGAGLGYLGARKSAGDLEKADTKQTARVSKLSQALDDVSPDAAERQLRKINRGRGYRLGGQFAAPAALFGTAEALRYAGDRAGGTLGDALNLAASAEQGAGTVMGAMQLKDLFKRVGESPNDPVDVAKIESAAGPRRAPPTSSRPLTGQTIDAEALPGPRRALPAPPSPPSSPAAPPVATNPYNPGTAKYMAWQLKNDFGVKGAWGMRKPELAAKLSEQLAEHGTKRTVGKRVMDAAKKGGGKAAIPLAVGAYMAGAGDSEAADGSMASRAGDAAVNFGTGAGAAYGGIKLSDLLTKAAPTAMRSLGGGAAMAMPGEMVSAMTDYPQEDLNMGRNWLARNLPEGMQFGAVDEAREMATVPPRSPANAGPRVPQQEEPAPGGFSPNIQGRLQRMISLGAPPEAIANFLNQSAAR